MKKKNNSLLRLVANNEPKDSSRKDSELTADSGVWERSVHHLFPVHPAQSTEPTDNVVPLNPSLAPMPVRIIKVSSGFGRLQAPAKQEPVRSLAA